MLELSLFDLSPIDISRWYKKRIAGQKLRIANGFAQ
jgi:hypothetical protein